MKILSNLLRGLIALTAVADAVISLLESYAAFIARQGLTFVVGHLADATEDIFVFLIAVGIIHLYIRETKIF